LKREGSKPPVDQISKEGPRFPKELVYGLAIRRGIVVVGKGGFHQAGGEQLFQEGKVVMVAFSLKGPHFRNGGLPQHDVVFLIVMQKEFGFEKIFFLRFFDTH
jgi:hypothetical protein